MKSEFKVEITNSNGVEVKNFFYEGKFIANFGVITENGSKIMECYIRSRSFRRHFEMLFLSIGKQIGATVSFV